MIAMHQQLFLILVILHFLGTIVALSVNLRFLLLIPNFPISIIFPYHLFDILEALKPAAVPRFLNKIDIAQNTDSILLLLLLKLLYYHTFYVLVVFLVFPCIFIVLIQVRCAILSFRLLHYWRNVYVKLIFIRRIQIMVIWGLRGVAISLLGF